ncbi:uncharacterized protein G2W53_014727 [Senna tora]|uniref:Uncharacterized protein n=1 Tax=Senna tora TaxID=362788 RepID=A0A835C4K4_9FABA|nr:uncharacterized protein G2W53_014727 [Senna tora]
MATPKWWPILGKQIHGQCRFRI